MPVTCTLDRAADARIGSPPLESQGVLFEVLDAKMARVYIYISIAKHRPFKALSGLERSWGLKAGLDPNRCRWGQIVARGLNAMDEINPGRSQWARCMDDLADAIEVVIISAEVSDAMPKSRT